jgi:hypothetical protein
MKHQCSCLRTLLCASVIGLATVASAVHSKEVRTGTIKSVTGAVSVVRGDSRLAALPGDAITERDRIATGPNSAAAFALRDGTSISLGPNSTVDLESFQYESTKQEGGMAIGLIGGTMRFITGLLGKHSPDRVRISTSTATVGIRGTDFILEAE